MSAHPPERLDREGYLAAWSALHGGAPARGVVRGWLGMVRVVARPLVAVHAAPGLLTAAGLAVALGAVWPAAVGGRYALPAAAAVVLAGLLDNLDGAVAVLSGRASRWGALLDALADRVADAGYAAALWVLGAPGPLAVASAGLATLHEYARARGQGLGVHDVAVVTVSERPTRVAITALSLLAAGIYPDAAAAWATGGTVGATVVGAVGLAQLLVVLRRRLR